MGLILSNVGRGVPPKISCQKFKKFITSVQIVQMTSNFKGDLLYI